MSGKAVPVGEPHEDHCSLAWTCDGICSCGPEGLRMQAEWSRAIRSEATMSTEQDDLEAWNESQRELWAWEEQRNEQPDWRAIAEELAAALEEVLRLTRIGEFCCAACRPGIDEHEPDCAEGRARTTFRRFEAAKGKVGG